MAPLPKCTTSEEASNALLTQLLAEPTTCVLVKSLGEAGNDDAPQRLRDVAYKAGLAMVRGPGAKKAGEVLAAFEKIIANPPENSKGGKERGVAGILAIAGELGAPLSAAGGGQLGQLMGMLMPKLNDPSVLISEGAAKGVASSIKGSIAAGRATIDKELQALLTTSLGLVKAAKTAEEARSGALGVGAVLGGAGVAQLAPLGVMAELKKIIDAKAPKDAPHCKEAAVLAFEQLSLFLGTDFEPYGIPLLQTLVGLYADKDKKVADAAAKGVKAMLAQLSPLAIKFVLPALYDGMEADQWRTRVECVNALAVLAVRAPTALGPRLPVAIPKLMECLSSSKKEVFEASKEALPILMSCVDNSEVLKLKSLLVEAFVNPDTTLSCLDELLATTFVNAMDGTALAFIMPLLLRGLKAANYELAKKACVSAGNTCALVKSPSEIAPFIPVFEPVLSKLLEHSSPVVREAAGTARTKLLDGAGDFKDPEGRPRELSAIIKADKLIVSAGLPSEVAQFAADTAAELLEQELGGQAKISYLHATPYTLAKWLSPVLSPYTAATTEALHSLGGDAVAAFRERMSEQQKAILNSADGKDYAVDIQNAILAFAGRVLLKGCDLRFERGHRYGLVGQNGTGKTTLLNRLGAKDITGFPQDLRTWYIRHEVLCDDGITVRQFLKQLAPEAKKTDAFIEGVLTKVEFPEESKDGFVNSLSGGWKMRMSIAISMLHEPELLLLDEPTNHLDREAIDWLEAHLLSLTGVTICLVSHDYDFIDAICTDITHYDNGGQLGKPCRFVYYPMSFSQFQKLKPEVAAGLPRTDKPADAAFSSKSASEAGSEAGGSDAGGMSRSSSLAKSMDGMSIGDSDSASDSGKSEQSTTISKVDEMIAAGLILPMRFPDPGKPEGIRTFRKPIMTLKDVSFKYPETDKNIIEKVTATLTLGSRCVIVGGNGSGKSTTLKLLIGDLEPEEGVGEVWKHHALRLSYVAQQSLHHLEDYVQQTPIHYIQERFRQGLDAEVGKLKTLAITDEDKEEMKGAGAITEIVGRNKKGKDLWYEVTKNGRVKSDTQQLPLSELEKQYPPYVKKLIKNFDQKQQALDSGMAIRPVTAVEILAHLNDFGVDSQLAHGKIRQMSGGQRQRLVICAAFWSKPHVIALDEPTNYLDNDSVAALTKALKDFKGAVVTVSENEAFTNEISNEKWVVENGSLTVHQIRDAKAR